MAEPRRHLIAGNWKMHGLAVSLAEARAIAAAVDEQPPAARVAICPPATLVHRLAEALAGTGIGVGGQDCRAEREGAFTGCLSAEMLADAGATLVILGHSERRANHHESDAEVRRKVGAAWRASLTAILCVGETKAERLDGRTLTVVGNQLEGSLPDGAAAQNLVIAYEPVWAIGTGLTPTPEDVAVVHDFIRERLTERFGAPGQGIRILYGGSVKPTNAKELLTVGNVDGALVGGASLKAAEFLAIAGAYA